MRWLISAAKRCASSIAAPASSDNSTEAPPFATATMRSSSGCFSVMSVLPSRAETHIAYDEVCHCLLMCDNCIVLVGILKVAFRLQPCDSMVRKLVQKEARTGSPNSVRPKIGGQE